MYWYWIVIGLLQHVHIDNIKSVANLSNNKDVFMCILRFHARAGYPQHHEALQVGQTAEQFQTQRD